MDGRNIVFANTKVW
jgi:hypothetical protein